MAYRNVYGYMYLDISCFLFLSPGCSCDPAYLSLCVSSHVCICIYTRAHRYIKVNVYVYVCINIHVYMCTHAHIKASAAGSLQHHRGSRRAELLQTGAHGRQAQRQLPVAWGPKVSQSPTCTYTNIHVIHIQICIYTCIYILYIYTY